MSHSLRLTKPDGSFDNLAAVKLEVLAFYSYDIKCVSQAFYVFETEAAYYHANRKDWQFSDIAMNVIHAASKRAGQVYIAGLVAILMAHLNDDGSRASLNDCSKVASEILYDMDRMSFIVPKARQWAIEEKTLVADDASIRKYFRRYRSAAHVCAAKALIGGSTDGHPLIKPLPQSLAYLSTVLRYQRLFQSWPSTKNWDLWVVFYEGDSFEDSYPPIELDKEALAYARDIRSRLRST